MNSIVANLVVNKKKMIQNLKNTKSLYNSQRVMLELIKKGLSREKAYLEIQRIAMKSWKEETSFKELLLKDELIKQMLSPNEIEDIFCIDYHFKQLNNIYKKVFNKI